MPALRFQTCRLLSGNVRKRELSLIQRRILRILRNKRRSMKRNLSLRENRNSNIKSQTTRKLPLSYGREMHRGAEQRTSYIPFLLNQETRSDVIPVRLHFSETLSQARQPISHRRVCVNNGQVSITHWKVSQGDLISLKEARGISRSFYIYISVSKRIGQFLPVRMWRRTKTEWFRLLKTQRGCRLLLQFLQEFRSEEDFEIQNTKVCLVAEHNRMKRWIFLSTNSRRARRRTLPFVDKSSFYIYSHSKYLTNRRKRIELPTHYSEVNHRTRKAVVSYGPHIGHIPHDIRLKDSNLPLRSGNGRDHNI